MVPNYNQSRERTSVLTCANFVVALFRLRFKKSGTTRLPWLVSVMLAALFWGFSLNAFSKDLVTQ